MGLPGRLLLRLLIPLLLSGSGCRNFEPPPSDPPSTQQIFADRTRDSGLEFAHFHGGSGELYMVENVGPGVALLDFDNDGDLDVFLVQGAALGDDRSIASVTPDPVGDRLFRNELLIAQDGTRTLRFTDVTDQSRLTTTGYGMGVATGDYDNDGWIDLYVTRFGSNTLYRNNGDGTFTDVTERSGADDPRWSVPAVFFDYDNDGWLDLYIGNYVDFRIANHRECRSDAGYRDYCAPHVYGAEPDRLLRNRGDGTFEDVTRRTGLHAAFGRALGAVAADFDQDGWLDLYVANDGTANQLWRNNGDGTFTDVALLTGSALNGDGAAEAGMGVDAGDMDNDGDEDIVIAHLALETNTVYVNDGTGNFEDRSVETGLGPPSWLDTGFGAGWVDYDNDSWLDFVVVNGAVAMIKELLAAGDPYPLHQLNRLYRNRGDGTFEDVTGIAGEAFAVSEVSRGLAFGDIDNDGDTDLVISNNNGPARLLINELGQRNRWIGLRLVDAGSGRDLLGAWVGVFFDGEVRWRRVTTSRSYASSSDPRVLIGLADSDVVDEVRVRWPDGKTESWTGLPVGTYSTLVRGSGR